MDLKSSKLKQDDDHRTDDCRNESQDWQTDEKLKERLQLRLDPTDIDKQDENLGEDLRISGKNGTREGDFNIRDKLYKRKLLDSDGEGDLSSDNNAKNIGTTSADVLLQYRENETLETMNASLKTLGSIGLTAMGNFINRMGLQNSPSLLNSNLSKESERTTESLESALSSLSSSTTAAASASFLSSSASKSSSVSPRKDDQRLHVQKPSFLITDILADSKKDRDACNSVFSDPRLLTLPHRQFLDRPMTASSCGSDHGNTGGGRFTDESDCEDSSENKGNETTK